MTKTIFTIIAVIAMFEAQAQPVTIQCSPAGFIFADASEVSILSFKKGEIIIKISNTLPVVVQAGNELTVEKIDGLIYQRRKIKPKKDTKLIRRSSNIYMIKNFKIE